MSLFFFSLRSTEKPAEVEEIELPNPHSARREELQICGDILREMDGMPGSVQDGGHARRRLPGCIDTNARAIFVGIEAYRSISAVDDVEIRELN